MQEDIVAKAMRSMGWGTAAGGSDVPLANDENRRLLQELEQLTEQRQRCGVEEEQSEARVEKIERHSKIATQAVDYNLKLLYAHQADLRTETGFFKVAEREHAKLRDDSKQLAKDEASMRAYVCQTEKELCKRHQHIDDLTGRIQWAKSALLEWNEAMADSHKGYQLIEKYFREDEQKARVRDQHRQRLQGETERYRADLVELKDEQRSLEQTLECTAQLYRSAHAERRQMVDTWKSAVAQMLQRERDIENRERQLLEVRAEANRRAAEYRRQDGLLNELLENNRQVEAAIEELNSETSDLKELMQRNADALALKANEVEVLQKELQNLASRVQQQRAENHRQEAEKRKKEDELQDFERVLGKLDGRKHSMMDKTMSAQERLHVLEDLMDVEAKAQQRLAKETGRLNELIFRAQQQLIAFKDEQKTLQVSNDGLQVTTLAVGKNAANTEKELQRQTEIHYNLGFKCVDLERRNAKMQGELVDPEQEQRDLAHLAEQEALLAAAQKRAEATEFQNRRLDDTVNKTTAVINADSKELQRMQFDIKEAQTYCEGGVKRVREATARNQTLIVELSLLRLRVSEFEDEIKSCLDCSYNLERHRAQLRRTIEDRMAELRGQQELLQSKRKHLQEERATLRADVGERERHIGAVRARFELTAQLLGQNDDGSLVTATQLKVEAAQERQLLLAEGNALNERVIVAEQEIKAMENTLLLINSSNESYRRGFHNLPEGDEAEEELKKMQDNYCNALNRLKQLRVQLLRTERETERAEVDLERLEVRLNAQVRKRLDRQEVLKKLQKELLDQQVKIERAEREMKLALKSARQQRGLGPELVALYERDLDVRDVEYRNTKALNQLADLADGDESLAVPLLSSIQERGLRLPHQLLKTHSGGSALTWRSGDLSEMSFASSKDQFSSMSRSSISESSQLLRLKAGSATTLSTSARVSIVSIDFGDTASTK